jgi:hypothetical protein
MEASAISSTPKTWDTPTSPMNFIEASEVEIQVIGTPATPYQLERSFDGVNFAAYSVRDARFDRYDTITAAGFFIVEGGAFIRMAAGAGSSLIVRSEV